MLRQVELRPNPSVNRTRYGRRRKAGAQRLRHCRAPALRRLPHRAGYLERCKPPITFDFKDTRHDGVFSATLLKEMASDALSTSA